MLTSLLSFPRFSVALHHFSCSGHALNPGPRGIAEQRCEIGLSACTPPQTRTAASTNCQHCSGRGSTAGRAQTTNWSWAIHRRSLYVPIAASCCCKTQTHAGVQITLHYRIKTSLTPSPRFSVGVAGGNRKHALKTTGRQRKKVQNAVTFEYQPHQCTAAAGATLSEDRYMVAWGC
jgi:hypothetical protein